MVSTDMTRAKLDDHLPPNNMFSPDPIFQQARAPALSATRYLNCYQPQVTRYDGAPYGETRYNSEANSQNMGRKDLGPRFHQKHSSR